MKNLKYISYLFLSILIITGCQKDSEIIRSEINLPESVEVADQEFSGTAYALSSFRNTRYITVKLIFEGVILDETKTNWKGEYDIPSQPVPLNGAMLLFERAGSLPNIVRIDEGEALPGSLLLYPIGDLDNAETGLSEATEPVKITGSVNYGSPNGGPVLYLKNSLGQLVGNGYVGDGSNQFQISTVPNETLSLYAEHYPCEDELIMEIPPLLENIDLDTLFFPVNPVYNTINISGNLTDCMGEDLTSNSLTIFHCTDDLSSIFGVNSVASYNINLPECLITHPQIAIIVSKPFENSFGEVIVDYIPGQDLVVDLSICEFDQTRYSYSLDGAAESIMEEFVKVRVLPDASAIVNGYYTNSTGKFVELKIPGISQGVYTGSVKFFRGELGIFEKENVNVTITLNDGDYIEGTISGSVTNYDGDAQSLESTFRARIQ